MTQEAFIKNYLPLANIIEKKYKIPALVSLAQSAIETSWGEKAFNHMMFGIKAGSSWNGKTQKLLTTEILTAEQFKKLKSYHSMTRLESGKYKVKLYQDFRAYNSPAESFEDYAKLLTENERYKAAFNYKDPYQFAREIARAGYATATNSYDALRSFIDTIKKKAVLKPRKISQLAPL